MSLFRFLPLLLSPTQAVNTDSAFDILPVRASCQLSGVLITVLQFFQSVPSRIYRSRSTLTLLLAAAERSGFKLKRPALFIQKPRMQSLHRELQQNRIPHFLLDTQGQLLQVERLHRRLLPLRGLIHLRLEQHLVMTLNPLFKGFKRPVTGDRHGRLDTETGVNEVGRLLEVHIHISLYKFYVCKIQIPLFKSDRATAPPFGNLLDPECQL